MVDERNRLRNGIIERWKSGNMVLIPVVNSFRYSFLRHSIIRGFFALKNILSLPGKA
jgi:hypothetical protein